MKKIFFFDVDGTLLPHGNINDVSEKTKYALNALAEQGHDVVLCTGKSEGMIQNQIAILNSTNHITMNGAQVVIDNQIVHLDKLTQQQINDIKDVAQKQGLMVGCQTRYDYYIADINVDLLLAEKILSKVSLDVPHVAADFRPEDDISQLWYLGDISNLNLDEELFPGLRLLKWHDQGCDIVLTQVSKGSAISRYVEFLHPDSEVIIYGFGDGANDLEMIELADVGVAMGNGTDELKAAADYITDDCIDDGVYNFLVKAQLIEELS